MTKKTFQAGPTPDVLIQRSCLLRQLRHFFDNRSFIEVQTPILSQDTVVDLYLDPMSLQVDDRNCRFLQTSPEFAMKRILASGLPTIYQITQAFRQEESGPRHNPEFTMLEWYRTGDSYQEGRQLLAELADDIFGQSNWGLAVQPCVQRSFTEAFLAATDLHPFTASTDDLVQRSRDEGLSLSTRSNFDQINDQLERREAINFLWGIIVDPTLGKNGPEIIYDWPGSEAALAKTRVDQISTEAATQDSVAKGSPFIDVEIAERFELYYRGFELANGYNELLDAEVLRQRNVKTNQQRHALGKPVLPSDSRLLQAMDAGLPECCGVALGVDRLLMSLLDVNDIDQVISFTWENA